MTRSLVASLAAGVLCGLFFGPGIAILKPIGSIYVGLIQMTILPYIVVSLIGRIGALRAREGRQLLGVGGITMLLVWGITLVAMFAFSQSFPTREGGAFFDPSALTASESAAPGAGYASNIFEAAAKNQIPAVVAFCLLVGAALVGVRQKKSLLQVLNTMSDALARVNGFIVRLTPLAVFSMTAVAAGTLTPAEFGQIGAYLFVYTVLSLFLMFGVFPMLVTALTPFTYRDIRRVTQDAALAAFATGKLIVALPMLIESTERLFAERAPERKRLERAPDVLFPLAYSFPHAGKIMAIFFVPFVAWFVGRPFDLIDYPAFLSRGLVSSFGGPLIAIPYLLEGAHLPRDSIELFLVSGIYAGRIGDMLSTVQITAYTLIVASATHGLLLVNRRRLVLLGAGGAGVALALVLGCRIALAAGLAEPESGREILQRMQSIESNVTVKVLAESVRNPEPLLEGESRIDRITRTKVLRVGYKNRSRPFVFENDESELVGFDIEMLHRLAADLDVKLVLVPFLIPDLVDQLNDDHFDLAMSGMVGSLDRAREMRLSDSYLDVTMSVVVPAQRRREFMKLDGFSRLGHLRIAIVGERVIGRRLKREFPDLEPLPVDTAADYFDYPGRYDALVISAEAGSAWTLFHPEQVVVVPEGRRLQMPLVIVMPRGDDLLEETINQWIELQKRDGAIQQFYDHWILGKPAHATKRTWSILRDVLRYK